MKADGHDPTRQRLEAKKAEHAAGARRAGGVLRRRALPPVLTSFIVYRPIRPSLQPYQNQVAPSKSRFDRRVKVLQDRRCLGQYDLVRAVAIVLRRDQPSTQDWAALEEAEHVSGAEWTSWFRGIRGGY